MSVVPGGPVHGEQGQGGHHQHCHVESTKLCYGGVEGKGELRLDEHFHGLISRLNISQSRTIKSST